MKNLKNHIPILLILLSSLFLCISCKKDDNGNRVLHYKTIGEGYIYDGTHNIPIKGATITVLSCFNGSEWFGEQPCEETFTTDENGYYQLRFIKWGKNSKVDQYLFEPSTGPSIPPPPPYWVRKNPSNTFPDISLYPEDIKGKKTITFDTIKYYQLSF